MFEKMRKACLALGFVLRSDIIPDRNRNDGRLSVLMHDHAQAIIQGELLIGNVDRRNEFGNRRWLLRGGERYRHCTDRYGKREGEAAKHGISLFWQGTLWEAHGYNAARPNGQIGRASWRESVCQNV